MITNKKGIEKRIVEQTEYDPKHLQESPIHSIIISLYSVLLDFIATQYIYALVYTIH